MAPVSATTFGDGRRHGARNGGLGTAGAAQAVLSSGRSIGRAKGGYVAGLVFFIVGSGAREGVSFAPSVTRFKGRTVIGASVQGLLSSGA